MTEFGGFTAEQARVLRAITEASGECTIWELQDMLPDMDYTDLDDALDDLRFEGDVDHRITRQGPSYRVRFGGDRE